MMGVVLGCFRRRPNKRCQDSHLPLEQKVCSTKDVPSVDVGYDVIWRVGVSGTLPSSANRAPIVMYRPGKQFGLQDYSLLACG